MRINIIGAGPIGGQTAYLLAKRGYDVHLYEDHAHVGTPVQCTGLMTLSLNDIVAPKKEFMVSTAEEQEVISPNGSKITIRSKEYIVDRTLFDNYFVNRAIDAGATLHSQHRFIHRENGFLQFRDKKNNTLVQAKRTITIGADGPISTVAKEFNMFGQREFYYGIQARVKGKFNERKIQVFFGNSVAPELFAWIVPENNDIARVGLGTKRNATPFFQNFMKQHNFTALDMQAGPIPVYNPSIPSQNIKEQAYLIGDAATQVKATTLGGLIPGLKAAQCLADAIEHNKNYQKLWKKAIGRRLWLHLKIRQVMDTFNDEEWNRFIMLIGQQKIKRIFEAHDREKPFHLFVHSLVKEPRMLPFILKVLKIRRKRLL
ncbi:NAD(P)/FAD-dependent oxidoreductase [Candidatus Woesearchaeota archaeon]|nr:NAD(P)/FAD-dependent oxidoreductase [Candidatus Woesearchaeota archaeon]